MTSIVTSTYRYKPPPKRKQPPIEAPAIVTIDPKTRVAKKGRRPIPYSPAAALGVCPP